MTELRWMAIAIVLIMTFSVDATFARVAGAPPATLFRGDPARTGWLPGPAIETQPIMRWSNDVSDVPIRSAPVIADGTVFVSDAAGAIIAVDTDRGTPRWRVQTTGLAPAAEVSSTPTVVNGVVYVGGSDGVYALDAATGELKWQFLTSFFPETAAVISSPVVVDSVVFVGASNGSVYALDARSGMLRWRYKTERPVESSPAFEAGVVFIGSWDGTIYALDAETGAERWKHVVGGPVVSTPAIADGLVFVATYLDSSLHALDAGDGHERWQVSYRPEEISFLPASPAVHDGLVVIGVNGLRSFREHDVVRAYDSENGTLRWSLRGSDVGITASPVFVDDSVLVSTRDGNVLGMDGTTGAAWWALAIGDPSASSPVVADGVLYVGNDAGVLASYEAT
jgi:outer membrane protein assembly factor BamB